MLIPDSVEAQYWFDQSARRGHVPAQYALGKLYLTDDAEVHDAELGIQWLEYAAHHGIIGHVSSSTTLNVYAHVTDEMRRTAAVKIDQGIGKAEPKPEEQSVPRKFAPSTFQAHKGQRRKAGTGCVTQINDHLWEGRYSPIWPDGKKHPRNTYAHSEEECEKQLAEMIIQMKAEIATEKKRLKVG